MFFAQQGNNRYCFSCFAFAYDIWSFQYMYRQVHTDLYSKKGRKLCFDFENHEWPFQLDVGGGGGGGGGREEGDRGELALLIVQIHEMRRGGGRCTKRFRRRNKWSKRGKTALVYLRNKQVSKNCTYRSVFQPVSFFFLIFFNFFSPNLFFFNQLSHIFPIEEVWSRAERRKCWFCDCGNRGKNIEGIWDSRSCYKFQNSQRLQEKDFSPPFSVQESVKKWGRV